MCIFIGLLRLSTYPSWVEHVQNMQVSEAYKNIHLYLIFIVSKIKSWAWRNHSLNVFLQFMIYMRVFFYINQTCLAKISCQTTNHGAFLWFTGVSFIYNKIIQLFFTFFPKKNQQLACFEGSVTIMNYKITLNLINSLEISSTSKLPWYWF